MIPRLAHSHAEMSSVLSDESAGSAIVLDRSSPRQEGILDHLRRKRWVLARVGIILAVLTVSGVWAAIDRQTPEWDQAHYLDVVYQYRAALHAGGLGNLMASVWSLDPSHPPLYELSLLASSFLFGETPIAAFILNLVLWPVLLLSVSDIAARLYGRRTAILAMALTATMPLVVGLSHEVLEDFELVTVVALSVALLLRAKLFSSWRASLALGAVLGVASWSKATFAVYLILPMAIISVQAALLLPQELRNPTSRHAGLARLRNGAAAVAIAVALAAAWYLPHLGPTLDYIRSATGGSLAIGTGPANPLTLHNIGVFTLGAIDTAIGLPVAVLAVLSMVLVLPRWLMMRAKGTRTGMVREMVAAAVLVGWAGLPYLAVVTAHNQDFRLMAGALPAIAILTAALILALPIPLLRWFGVAALAAAGTALTVGMTWPFTLPLLPTQFAVDTRLGWVYYPISPPQQLGYERIPQSVDYMNPVMAYLASVTRGEHASPPVVCVLETDPDINVNTLTYLADVSAEMYTFQEIHFTGDSSGMQADLHVCDVALYVPPPPATGSGRVTILNQSFAQTHMTARDFAIFGGPRPTFPIDFGESVQILTQAGL